MQLFRHHFDMIESTNTWGKENIASFSTDGLTVVSAREQTAGRGRFNRRWMSPAGQNIYVSFCFRVDRQRKDIGNIPQVLALSALCILERLAFTAMLKWPNDLLVSRKKIAGILAETTPVDHCLGMVIGIGLNVNMPKELLERIDQPATSMLAESGANFDVEAVLQALQQQFADDLELFLARGMAPFLPAYRQKLFTYPGEVIRFHDNRQIWQGTFHAIDDEGALVLKLLDGTLRTFIAGEIIPS